MSTFFLEQRIMKFGDIHFKTSKNLVWNEHFYSCDNYYICFNETKQLIK